MQELTSNNCGCGSSSSSKPEPSKNESFQMAENNPGLSSSGVSLMPSMDSAGQTCCPDSTTDNTLSEYEKPGYKLCRYVEKFQDTPAGPIPVIKPKLSFEDLFSTFYVRCGIHRYNYTVAPGLYAIGEPDNNSEVLVTANFKLTVDHLRKELKKINAWILVLDTKGINVWCAAGKGTFSTTELVKRIKESNLEKVVNHKRVIVPQLGATGVSAREVKSRSGFRVVYGPVRANDIPAFLENGKKADKKMRLVTFNMYERFILTPVEIQIALKPALITALILLILSGFGPGIFSFSALWDRGLVSMMAMITGIFSGAFLTPVLLPFIPGRQFALKGIITGSLFALILVIALAFSGTIYSPGASGLIAVFLFSVAISSFLAMNFTGTTPFTSPTGVELEMRRFIPAQLAAVVLSTGLWIYSAF